jgi:hypothetical protein
MQKLALGRCASSGLTCVRENSVVPSGLESFLPLLLALPRWARLVRTFWGLDCRAFHPTGLPENW